jgi:hypothetical protein
MVTTMIVELTQPRFSFDGPTGAAVLVGTRGIARKLDVHTAEEPPTRRHARTATPTLTVDWAYVLVQNAANDDPDCVTDYKDTNVPLEAVRFITTEESMVDDEEMQKMKQLLRDAISKRSG